MALLPRKPGVYIEEIPKFSPSIAPVETAIPAFIGYTQRADDLAAGDLILKAKKIFSLVEYEKYFGLPQSETNVKVAVQLTTSSGSINIDKVAATLAESARSKHLMYYALQMFFANGGSPCYIISVGLYKAALGDPLLETELAAALDVLTKQHEPTLIVFPEAQNLFIGDFKTLHNTALAQCELLKDRFVIMDIHGDTISLSDPDADLVAAVDNFRSNGIGTNNLKYGAAYAPNIETVLNFSFNETQTDVMITTDGIAATSVKLDTLKSGGGVNSRVYEVSKVAIRDIACKMPPSSAMAGIFAAVDNSRGVWKAPANVSMRLVTAPATQISNVQQTLMNVDVTTGKSVNAIRAFTGKGTLVWGARTLAGNDNEWRYISVRRFFNFVEASCRKAMEQFVFAPNDAKTWVRVQRMIENFLTVLWRQGALQGIMPEHAFYVAVGLGKTMTAIDIMEGRMIVLIGMAVVRPAEFIILRIIQNLPVS